MMKLPFFIARRYLFAKKSHNVINIVSAISAVGMAVGTAALIIILSVYNGFDSIVKGMFSTVEPDFMIVPSQGKHFIPEGDAFDWAYECKDIKSMSTVLQENVFVSYEDHQGTALVKGVDPVYMEESSLADYVRDGEFVLSRDGDGRDFAAVGTGLARQMGINIHFLSPINIYFPDSRARVSVINPMSSVSSRRLWPSCEFSVNAEIDSKLMIVSRDVMASLLGVGDEASAVEVRLAEGLGERRKATLKKQLQSALGPDSKVLDRAQQNPSLYKMLRYEKLAVYMIMLFVVLILGFCIFGSLSMLIIDKSDDIATLDAMGMDRSSIRNIFTLEGWFITLGGMTAGLVIAVLCCVLQQQLGIVRMPSNFLIEAYPVILKWQDMAIAAASIAFCGYIVAWIPSRKVI